MTKYEVEAVFERAQTWPDTLREDAARLLTMLEVDEDTTYVLSDEERLALDDGEASGVSPQPEVDAVFNRGG